MDDGKRPALNKARVRASFHKAADAYDAVAVLQREVGRRLLERLDIVRLNPRWVVDVGAGTGAALRPLSRRFPQAEILALDVAQGMVRQAQRRFPWWSSWHRRRPRFLCADAEQLPLADSSCDLLFSNLALQWCAEAPRVFREFRRVLRPGGLLLFTTLGPDTLKELRASWAAVDDHVHVNTFGDMHDIGDALLHAGLADPVMDMEHITLAYRRVRDLVHELKALGAHNVNIGRAIGLTGKGRFRRMEAAYEAYRHEGVLPATYEVIYGIAWVGATARHSPEPGVARVGVETLRRHPGV